MCEIIRKRRCGAAALLLVALCAAPPAAGGEKSEIPRIGPSALGSMRGMTLTSAADRIFVESAFSHGVDFESVVRDHKGRKERHSVSLSTGMLGFEYELHDKGELLQISLAEDSRVHIACAAKSRAKNRRFEFDQSPGKPLSISFAESGTSRRILADTIWEMLVVEPDLCRRYLMPVLRPLQQGSLLAERAGVVEETLLEFALADRRQLDLLVADLASRKFGTRRSAERKLREIGPAVIPYLQGLDPRQLDAEQKHCIVRIIEAVDTPLPFSPEMTAAELACNRRVWMGMMERPSVHVRRLAAGHLELLLGEPVRFDPAADEATRKAQLDRLKRRFPARSAADQPPQ